MRFSKKNINNQRGLTLIEMVVAVGVFAVVVTAASASFVTLSKGTGKAKVTQTVNQTARSLIEQITREAKFAIGAKVPSTDPGMPNRVWPPFLVRKATVNDTLFDLDSNILIIVTTEDSKPKFKAYGVKVKKLKVIIGQEGIFPPEPTKDKYFDSTFSPLDVIPSDVIIANAAEDFKITTQPSTDLLSLDPESVWIYWDPEADLDNNLKIEPFTECTGSIPLSWPYCSHRATKQPLLVIENFKLSSTTSPSSDPNARASISISTAISSRDYDLDN